MKLITPTPFASSLLGQMRQWRAFQEHGDPNVKVGPFWPDWTDGICPEFRELAAQAVIDDAVRLHTHIEALNSSMTFGFNLFLPFRAGADLSPAVVDVLGPLIVDQVVFEWIPPGGILGEIDGETPRDGEAATGIDVLLRGWRDDGSRVVILVEVKLSEGGFSTCGGRKSRANRRPDVCEDVDAFLAEPSACYLRRPIRKQRDRRYWEIFQAAHGSLSAAFPGVTPGPCPFAGDAQQPMRQYALALGLEQAEFADEAWLLLVHHDDNPDVPHHWEEWMALTQPEARIARLPASAILDAGRTVGLEDWANWMAGRYCLESP